MFEGALESAISIEMSSNREQTPNLWWPADHSWCVASEIDLPWTYVAGSSELIGCLLDDDRLETTPSSPEFLISPGTTGWLSDLIQNAVDEVISTGSVTLTLPIGTVNVEWEPSRRRGRGRISTRSQTGGWSSGGSQIHARSPVQLRDQIGIHIQHAVFGLSAV